jgi:hypothetical protein
VEASIVDLRYKMKGVIQSLKRNECVKIYYHKSWIGTIVPRQAKQHKINLSEHPFFGMHSKNKETVDEQMQRLRGGRYS